MHAHVFEKHLLVGLIKVGNFGFGLGADGDDRGVFGRGEFANGIQKRIVFRSRDLPRWPRTSWA